MAVRLFGVETEYALTALDRRGASVERQTLLLGLLDLARERLVHLPDRSAAGVFLASGRLYIDAGEHPEFSTVECAHPDDVVRYVRAGDHILHELAQALVERRRDVAEVIVLRSNVDYSGSHATWASHESYLHRVDPARLPRQIIPHLVSRIVYTGAGGFNSFSGDAVEFTLSPRVWHLQSAISPQSTGARGIFHTKDESLSSDGYHRLHIICGETLCSDSALWLRIGATALVVALIEAGIEPGEGVQLKEPLAAMQCFASDPTCRATAETERGEPMTALAIQRHYLALARRHAEHERMPPWTADVCDRWGSMLDRLEAAPESVASHVDWAIKLALYRKHVERRAFAWQTFPEEDRAVHGLRVEPFDAQLSLPIRGARRHGCAAGAVDTPAVAGPDPLDFMRLRGELFEIDLRFGQLGNTGIFAALDRAGVLRQRLIEPADVARAREEPPATGRAFVRGTAIRRLHAQRGVYCCGWSAIVDRRSGRVLDLSDPFATDARWSRSPRETIRPPDRVQSLHDRAMALYGQGRYDGALELFLQAVSSSTDRSPSSAVASSRFWAATVLHNLGRLREARALLDELVRMPPDEDLLYMALTRRAIIDVEAPSPLCQIERSIEAAETHMAELGHSDWRSRILLARARLLEARGLYEEALATAVEGLERRQVEPNGIAMTTHMRSVLLLTLRANRLAEAAAYIEEWSSWTTEYPRSGEILLAWGRSELARAHEQADEAVRRAEEADQFEEARIDRAIRGVVGEALVRALLCKGDLSSARAALVPLRRLRAAEAGADRYGARLLWADYQLACAQRSAGLPILDPVRGLQFDSPPASRFGFVAAARWLRSAERSYERAQVEGRQLDALLECNVRQREIAERRTLVERTREEIAALRVGGPRARPLRGGSEARSAQP